MIGDFIASSLNRLPKQSRSIVKTIVYGLSAGLVAVAFHFAIHGIYENGIGRLADGSVTNFVIWSFVIVVGTSAISGWLLSAVCPEAAGSGIPQVKLAFWKDMGYIPWRVVWVKFIGGALSVGGGASLGREGPSVQLASGLSSELAGFMGEPKHKRRIANAAAAAAGLAAAFNTPIAAVTFVLEEIVGDLNSKMLGSILLASVIGALVAHGFLGEQPSFTLHAATPVVAAISALAGVVFHRTSLDLRLWNKGPRRLPAWSRTALGGLAVWAIGCAVFVNTGKMGVFGLGYDDLSAALDNQLGWKIAMLLLAAKLCATAICYGLGGCGGIFAPTLFFGGMAGAGLAGLLELVVPLSAADHVTLAVVGMCSCLGAVVRAPVTGLLIVFEMTHEFSLVPALMVGGLISLAIGKKFNRVNFYDEILEQDGQHVERVMPPRDLRSWLEAPISRAANFRPIIIKDLSPDYLAKIVSEHRHDRFPVVLEGKLAGVITLSVAEMCARDKTKPVLEPVAICRRDTTIREAQTKIIESPSNMVVVVGGEDAHVIGLLTLHDILRAEMLLSKET